MIDVKELPLPQLLPAESASCSQCLTRLRDLLRGTEGIADAELDQLNGVATVHYDPNIISLPSLEDLVQREGAHLGEAYAHREVPVEGMDCADCAMTLERGVGRLPGVTWVSINFAGARMSLEYEAHQTDMDAVSKRVESLGYHLGGGGETHAAVEAGLVHGFVAVRSNQITLIAGALTAGGGILELLSVPALASIVFFGAAILVAGMPLARKAFNTLRATRQIDINTLMVIAIVGAAVIGAWFEAALVVVLFSLGESLEGYTMDRARRSIRALLSFAPAEAVVRHGEHEHRTPVAEINVGDVVIVRPGERFPLDGVIQHGSSTVNQAPITGESLPVEKAMGDEVFAGTINGSGVLDVRTTRKVGDSTIARIIRMVEDAQAQKAPSQRFVDVFARYYTPAVVALAVAIALLPPLAISGDWVTWFYRALVLLVVACPCALVISTPVSIVAAISAAARNGVLIKGGAYLEAAGSIRALAFDKTGTLTQGEPVVTSVVSLGNWSEDDVLALAGAAERFSEHPLGQAIVRAVQERTLDHAQSVTDVSAETGRGIQAMVNGHRVRVGAPAYTLNEPDQEIEDRLAALERKGQTAVVVSFDGTAIGLIGLADSPRAESRAALQDIKRAGIRTTAMLTGERRTVAEAIAAQIGVDEVEAELLPEQKVDAIERLLQRYGSVGMVGDGINDAPALARSTVGIAMGAAGTDTALETADIALMRDDLSAVEYTIRLSRSAKRIIGENIGLALAIKLVFLSLAIAGLATLWLAVLADVGASLIVIANGMRLLRFRSAS
ncbi:MAG: cation-translocating P-type ATPase [Nitrolancea sp.]